MAAEKWIESLGFDEQGAVSAGKRCAVEWAPWMHDWFVSSSPRNSNSHAEGPWDHWVDLALGILSDPLTAIVRPDVHDPALKGKRRNFYDEADRQLTPDELRARFDRSTGDL
jgi:hypothetical protein